MQLETVFRYHGYAIVRKTKSTAIYHHGKPLVIWKMDEDGNWNLDGELDIEKELSEGKFLLSIVAHKLIEPESESE